MENHLRLREATRRAPGHVSWIGRSYRVGKTARWWLSATCPSSRPCNVRRPCNRPACPAAAARFVLHPKLYRPTQAGETFPIPRPARFLPAGLCDGTLSELPPAGAPIRSRYGAATPPTCQLMRRPRHNYRSSPSRGPTPVPWTSPHRLAVTLSGPRGNLATGQVDRNRLTPITSRLGPPSAGHSTLGHRESSSNALRSMNSQGATNCFAPAGSPYVSGGQQHTAPAKPPGNAYVTNSSPCSPSPFTPRVAAGGTRYDPARLLLAGAMSLAMPRRRSRSL